MGQIVIDASVFVKLFIKEENSENAFSIIDAYVSQNIDILVPSLFGYEVLNAIKYSKSYTEKEMDIIADTIEGYKFKTSNLNSVFSRPTVNISSKYGITVYDASYIALAEANGAKFYTADEKLVKSVKLPSVHHIRDFK